MLTRRVAKEKAKAMAMREREGKVEGEAGSEGEGQDGGVTNPLELADRLRYDFCVGEAMVGESGRFKGIRGVGALLMGGTKSQGFWVSVWMRWRG